MTLLPPVQALSSGASAVPGSYEAVHFAVESFVCNIYFDSARMKEAVEPSIDAFYRTRKGAHPHPRVSFVLTEADTATVDLPAPTSIKEKMVVVGYPVKEAYETGETWLAGEWSVIHNRKADVLYLVNRGRRVCQVIASQPQAVIKPFIRTLRLAIVPSLREIGYTALHASSIVMRGLAVVIAGERGAGKTTLMLDILRNVGGEVLAFDKVLLRPRRDGIVCVGEPASLGLAIGTARRFDLLLEQFPPSLRRLGSDKLWGRGAPSEKARISADQVASRLPFASDGPYPLGAVLFPQIGAGCGARLEPIGSEEAASLLRGNVMLGPIAYNPDWLRFGGRSDRAGANASELMDAMVSRRDIEYYRVLFGEASPSRLLPELRQLLSASSG